MTDEGACKVGTAVAIGCAGPAAAGADWIAGDSDRDEASEVAADESRITTGGEADDTGVGSRVFWSRFRSQLALYEGGYGADLKLTGGGPVRFGALRTILSEPVLVLGDSLVCLGMRPEHARKQGYNRG